MIETARARVLVVVLILLGHALLFPLYAQQPVNPDAGVFPDEDEFTTAPDEYVGDRVDTDGFVQETSPLVIAVETTRGRQLVTITDTDLSPAVGDRVRVFGTLRTPTTIQSTTAFVVPASGLWYTWLVSFGAGLWVLVRLIRHWTVDRSRLCFRSRDTPLSLRDTGSSPQTDTGDEHA